MGFVFSPRQYWLVGLLVVALCGPSWGQVKPESYRVFDGQGKPATLTDIVAAGAGSEAVFLGENHDDKIAHGLQLEIFQGIAGKAQGRKLALSLEMFERDTQTVLDEYLNGVITETHFLNASRPWKNYAEDYKPLVEFAREKKLPVIAANAPRRYVNLVARQGRQALDTLSPAAKNWLAPLPYPAASEAYGKKFSSLMGGMASHGSKMLDSQSLWDATMADAVAAYLKKTDKGLAVHLNGRFHTESRLGTVEMLEKYRPGTKVVVVTMVTGDGFPNFNDKLKGAGDFVILTEPKA